MSGNSSLEVSESVVIKFLVSLLLVVLVILPMSITSLAFWSPDASYTCGNECCCVPFHVHSPFQSILHSHIVQCAGEYLSEGSGYCIFCT